MKLQAHTPAITAAGLVTSLGLGYEANKQKLIREKDGLTPISLLDSVHKGIYHAGEIKLSDAQLRERLSLPEDELATRSSLFAVLALKEIFQQLPAGFLNKKIAFINATTGGGMSSVEQHYLEFIKEDCDEESKRFITALDCAETTLKTCKLLNFQPAFDSTVSTACSSSANAIIIGAKMLQQGLVDAVICGGCDAFSKFAFNGFLSLKNVDKNKCLPFDKNRFGLNLGEGAGYVLMERKEDAEQRNATVLGYLTGYSNNNDVYHPTAPSPDGSAAENTMRQALQKAQLQPSDIHYINAHGTATDNNDSSEIIAIENVFGKEAIYSSTKSFIGHTLAASGVIECIYSIMAISEQTAWANLRWQNKMDESSCEPVTGNRQLPIQNVISNSFGFGGNNVSLILSKG